MAAGESKEADYGEVLLQVVARIIDRVDGANASTCYLALDPDSLDHNSGRHTFIVSPLSGDFSEGAFVGGGIAFLETKSGCIVKIHCPSLADKAGHDVLALTDESLGLLRKASAVISALAPSTAAHPPQAGWVPSVGDYGLTSPFRPVRYSLHKHPNNAIRSMEILFSFDFDWDTTQQ